MNSRLPLLASIALVSVVLPSLATTLYVDVNSTNPVPPYTNWATAATVIQDAVDAAVAGDTVLVTNGVYDAGGTAVDGTVTNRVFVDKPLTLMSVHGPEFTIIQGYQVPGTTNGDGAIRCVYLANGASLIGFTLTNGATLAEGSHIAEVGAGGLLCTSTNEWASNCVMTGNSARFGGGACLGTLNHCTLMGNSANYGGGTFGGALDHCTLAGNSAGEGGGSYVATLNHCTLTGNSAGSAGGAFEGSLNHCTLTGNSATHGGGSYSGTLNNCTFIGNRADEGGGAKGSTLNNCTLVGNSAEVYGGGAYGGTLNNCILHFNNANGSGDNYDGAILNYCSTTPLPYVGTDNITNAPLFMDTNGWTDLRLQSDSPCINAGNNAYVSTPDDLDGNPRIRDGIVDMGAYEFQPPDTHYVSVNSTNPVPPYTNWATAASVIQDAVEAASAGDTVLVTNGVYDMGGKAIHGTMTNRVAVKTPLMLMSVNGPEWTIIQGSQVPGTTNGNGAIRCVFLTNGASLSGFTLTNGATITSTIDTQYHGAGGGGVYCEPDHTIVTNCILIGNAAYLFGGGGYQGTFSDCVIASNRVGLFGLGGGVNGGTGAATLDTCMLVGNSAGGGGGGAFNCTLTDCTVAYNSTHADGSGSSGGGGAFAGRMTNCLFYGNASTTVGGGVRGAFLYGCTVAGNSADDRGGGSIYCWLQNCIVYYNGGNGHSDQSVDFSCVSQSVGGNGNITNAPLFVDTNGWADLRLQSNSPCINAGNNAYVTSTNDLDGNPRIEGGTVDMGAYEFQDPQSSISYAYLQQYGLPTDGSVDEIDGDGDKATTWQEWKAWTIPTNGISVLKMLRPDLTTNGIEVSWQSVSNHTYTLERAAGGTASFTVLHSNIAGLADTTSFMDTTATNGNAFLYRVSVPE